MSDRQYKDFKEVYIVQFLGETFGYGHIMKICHELWVRMLEDEGNPTDWAHVPVSLPMVKEEYKDRVRRNPRYQNIVDRAFGGREDVV